MKSLKNNPILILLLTCFAIYFVNLDALYVNIMEARNFITAREMLQNNNWLLPTLNGESRYQKPPLPIWFTAISALIFGLKSLFALRLPAALAALLLIFTSYKLLSYLTENRKYALISSLILATSFYIVYAGRNGQWDIFSHAFMLGCIYYIYRLFKTREKKNQYAILAALFFGLSFMSKGPVSVYILLFPFLVSFILVYKLENKKSLIKPLLLFLLISTLLSSWWYVYVYFTDPLELTRITQIETLNWQNHNVRTFYYYWNFFVQSGVWSIMAFIGLLYPYLKNKVSNKKAYLFTLLWTIFSLILLSLTPEKKSRYLLPVLIPLAFNTGFYLEYIITQFRTIKNKVETIPVYLNFGLIGGIGLIFPIAGYFYLKDSFYGNWIWFILLSICTFFISIFIFKYLLKKNIQMVFYLTIVYIISIIFFGLPIVKKLAVNPDFNRISKLISWETNTNNKTYEFSDLTPELIWDYGKPMKILTLEESIIFPTENSFGVLIRDNQKQRFLDIFKDYSLKKITRFDMNPREKGSSQYRSRLCRDLYLVSKK